VYTVDLDAASEVAMEYDVSTLPRLLFFKDGQKVDDYLGSSEAEVSRLFAAM
jgi:thioredoxin-like negative regulator of GroEL